MGSDRKNTEPLAELGDIVNQRSDVFSGHSGNNRDQRGRRMTARAVRDAIIHVEQAMLLLKHDEVYGRAEIIVILTLLDDAYQKLWRIQREQSEDDV
jgi:hypothetical protein